MTLERITADIEHRRSLIAAGWTRTETCGHERWQDPLGHGILSLDAAYIVMRDRLGRAA